MRAFDELVSVAQRATNYLGGSHPDTIKAIAHICRAAIEDGIWGMEKWVPRPAELPDTDDELHEAATSKKAIDRDVRRAVLDWRMANEAIEIEGAERLRVAALNFIDLEPLREAGDEEARSIQIVLYVHARRAFYGATLPNAPHGREELERWCRRIVGAHNPVPVWLRSGSAPRNIFRPPARSSSEPARVGSLFAGYTREEEDR